MPEDKKEINKEIKFNDMSMDNLTEKERLGVMYFAGINALREKIEDNTNLLFKLCTLEEDNVIFSTLFFLFVIITGNNNEVKNTLLKCKEEEFEEKKIDKEKVNEYIDVFNKRVKELATIYLDVNTSVNDDLEFQKKLINSYSTYMMDNLKIEKKDESYKELEIIFLSALKIAFGFRDAEKNN